MTGYDSEPGIAPEDPKEVSGREGVCVGKVGAWGEGVEGYRRMQKSIRDV